MKLKKEQIIKIIMLILVIAILVYLTIKIIPLFKNIATVEGRMQFKEEIQGMGIKGVLVIQGLMLAQIFLAILPGEPVEVLAGMCFGPIGGLFVIYLGVLVSSTVIFFLVRKFGRNFIYSFVPEDKIKKIENSKWFSDPKKLDFTLFILFFIPGTPKDLLTYLGGILPIKPGKFILISTLARFPSIISSTIAGSGLMDGNIKMMIITYLITFILTAAIMLFIYKKDKNKMDIVKM